MNEDEINKYNKYFPVFAIVLSVLIITAVYIPFIILNSIENRLFITVSFPVLLIFIVSVIIYNKIRHTGFFK